MKALILIELDENHLVKQGNDLYDRLQGYDCELVSLPKKLNSLHMIFADNDPRLFDDNFANGWNACVDEITGEHYG